MVAVIVRASNDSWENATSEEFFICSDGIVLKGKEHQVEKYESIEKVDYNYFSALRVKHLTNFAAFGFQCFEQNLSPSQYRLCLSSAKGHRDFTLSEARTLLAAGKDDWWAMTGEYLVNHEPPRDLQAFIKISEYVQLDPGIETEIHTLYLTPDGRLTTFRVGYTAVGGDINPEYMEIFDVFLQTLTEPVLDYEATAKAIGQ